ncbi:MAG: SusF/SusE family outer membrane protein [Paludibacteraceae bacterium]|nr:SusF/SusE family outer membrane protein [Paludibacteraceae bacterium]
MKTQLLSILVALIVAVPSFANTVSLIGEATPGGWSLDKAVAMKPMADDVFEFVGDLKDGSLKLITQNDFAPSYGPQTNGDSLVIGTVELAYRATYDDPDNAFAVKAGRYSLVLDLSGEVAKLTVADGTGLADKWYVEYPDTLYAVGDATVAGWTATEAIALSETADNSGIYVDTLLLKSGELKFLNQKDWGAGYGARVANEPINNAGVYALAALDSTDMKFKVALLQATEFVVEVNVVEGSLTLTALASLYPEKLYILGDAVGGWSFDTNAQEMTLVEEGVFTWSGFLVEGEMKFFVDKDFSASAYGAVANGTSIAASGEYAIELLGGEDKKFVATKSQVEMTIDLKEMKMVVEVDTIASAVDMVVVEGGSAVYDIMGRLRMISDGDILPSALPAGMYIIKTNNQSKKVILK